MNSLLTPSQNQTLSVAFDILQRHRAVLLYEATGSGKTFVAAALAAHCLQHGGASPTHCAVIAPAHLLDHWQRVLAVFRVPAACYSYQAASLGTIPESPSHDDFWILDEAHFLRNPATKRYQFLLRHLATHRICLITATPVTLSWNDLHALMRLAGFPAEMPSTDPDWVRHFACAITPQAYVQALSLPADFRPQHAHIEYAISPRHDLTAQLFQTLRRISWFTISPSQHVDEVPLLTQLLWHRLLSHRSACLATLRRLFQYYRTIRLHPERRALSRTEFRKLMGIDGRQQILPLDSLIFGGSLTDADRTRLDESCDAMRSAIHIAEQLDATPDEKLLALRTRLDALSPSQKAIIFTQYADSAIYLAEHLDRDVALLTPQTASLGRYAIDPQVLLAFFSPSHAIPEWWQRTGRPQPQILVCTDAFACGQNLQIASVLIHFDLPWNPSTLRQREGRIMRIGQTAKSLQFLDFRLAEAPGAQPLCEYQCRLWTRLHERRDMQASWLHDLAPVRASRFLQLDVPNLPRAWAQCRDTWIPVHPAKIPAGTDATDTTLDRAFAPQIRRLQKSLTPIWNALKRYAPPRDDAIRVFMHFARQAAFFPQTIPRLPPPPFTPENSATALRDLRSLPTFPIPNPQTPCRMRTTCPQHLSTVPQTVHTLSTA